MTGSGDAVASHLSSFSFTLTTHHNGSGALNTRHGDELRPVALLRSVMKITSKGPFLPVNSFDKAEELGLFIAQVRLDRVHECVA